MATKKQTENKRAPIPEGVDSHTLAMVTNGFFGRLCYKSKKTGEEFIWEDFGGEQEIELGELRAAKTSQKAFFQNCWFMFNDEYSWVIDYLGLGAYYDNAIDINQLESIFEKSPSEVDKILKKAPEGQRQSIAYKATQLYNDDKIDSIKLINVLEENLGITLRM